MMEEENWNVKKDKNPENMNQMKTMGTWVKMLGKLELEA